MSTSSSLGPAAGSPPPALEQAAGSAPDGTHAAFAVRRSRRCSRGRAPAQRCSRARRYAPQRGVRRRQRRRRPDVHRRGARAPTRTTGPAVRRTPPASCSSACSTRSGSARGDVFIANVLKCRPPGNRDPLPAEIENCQEYLFEQVELVAPRVICSLGNFSTKLLRRDPAGHHPRSRPGRGDHARPSRRAAVPDLPSRGRPLHAADAARRCARTSRACPELLALPAPEQPERPTTSALDAAMDEARRRRRAARLRRRQPRRAGRSGGPLPARAMPRRRRPRTISWGSSDRGATGRPDPPAVRARHLGHPAPGLTSGDEATSMGPHAVP